MLETLEDVIIEVPWIEFIVSAPYAIAIPGGLLGLFPLRLLGFTEASLDTSGPTYYLYLGIIGLLLAVLSLIMLHKILKYKNLKLIYYFYFLTILQCLISLDNILVYLGVGTNFSIRSFDSLEYFYFVTIILFPILIFLATRKMHKWLIEKNRIVV